MLPLDLLQIFKPLLLVLPIIVLIGIAKSPWFKGIIGEALVKLVAKIRLPVDTYVPIHDVTLLSMHASLSDTTQIDHILVSNYGLFVVEPKKLKSPQSLFEILIEKILFMKKIIFKTSRLIT